MDPFGGIVEYKEHESSDIALIWRNEVGHDRAVRAKISGRDR